VVDPVDVVDAGDRRHSRAAARGDQDSLPGQLPVAHLNGAGIDKRAGPGHDAVTGLLQNLDPALLIAVERILPPPRLRKPDRGLGEIDSTLRSMTPHVVHQLGRDDVGLRGTAGDVGAGTAPQPVLDQRDPGAVISRCSSGAVSCR